MNEARSGTRSVPFPAKWKRVKIGQLVRRIRKPVQVEPNETYTEIGIRSHGKGIFYKEPRTGVSLGSKSVYWIQPDCFIVNIVFAWEQAIAKTTIEQAGMIASHRFRMYRPETEKVNLDYLVYFFNTPRGKYLLELASPGGAGRNRTLGQTAFLNTYLPLPPLDEQRQIVEILATWDKAVALVERRIHAASQRKKGMMQRLLTGRVQFPEFVGESWHEVRLRQILDIQYGKPSSDIHEESGPYHIYGTGGVLGTTNDVLCNEPAVIIGRKGTIDQPQLAREPFWAIDTTYYATSRTRIDIAWVYHVLNYQNLERYNEASGVPSLSRDTLYSIQVKMPGMEEQRRIAEALNTCDREIELLQQKRAALDEQKKGLMQRLLTGRVRVNV